MSENLHVEVVFGIGIPRGMAAVVSNNRVLWFGEARNFRARDWPKGTKLNLGIDTYSNVKRRLQMEPGVEIVERT